MEIDLYTTVVESSDMLEEDNPEVEQESDTDIRDFDEKFVPELESEQDPETEIE